VGRSWPQRGVGCHCCRRGITAMRRGEIRVVNLGDVVGVEATRIRLAVTVSSDGANTTAARLGRGVVSSSCDIEHETGLPLPSSVGCRRDGTRPRFQGTSGTGEIGRCRKGGPSDRSHACRSHGPTRRRSMAPPGHLSSEIRAEVSVTVRG